MAAAQASSEAIPVTTLLAASPVTRGRGEKNDSMLTRVSHLNLQQRKLVSLNGIGQCHNLRTLYAYDNEVAEMTAEFAMTPRLTHLYLQHNLLQCIDFLHKTSRLTKLFLEGNALEVISGLEACTSLTELHVSNQRGEAPLQFESASLQAISGSLTTLTCAGNRLTDLAPLAELWRLRTVDVSHNALESLQALQPLFAGAGGLSSVAVAGNPCTTSASAPGRAKVQDAVILMAPSCLASVDGEDITPERRHFLYAREMKRRGVPLPAPAPAPTRGPRAHHGPSNVTKGAGGGWKGRAPGKGGPIARQATGPMGVGLPPTFAAASSTPVPGGRPMPKEGTQRPSRAPVKRSGAKPATGGFAAGGLSLSGAPAGHR